MKRLLYAGGLTVWLKVASMGVTLTFVSLMSFLMTKEDYGLLATLMSVALFASGVGSLGQQNMMVRDVSQALARGDEAGAKGLAARTSRWVLVASIFVGGTLAVFYGFNGYGVVFALSVLALVVLISLNQAWSGVARAQDRYVWALAPRDLFWRAGISVGALGWYAVTGPVSLEFAAGLAVFVLFVLMVAQSRALDIGFSGPRPVAEPGVPRSILNLTIISLSGQLQNTLDVALVGTFMSAELAAEYFPANRLALVVAFVPLSLKLVIGSQLAKLAQSGNKHEAQKVMSAMTLAGFIATVLVGGTFVAGFPLLEQVFPTATHATFHAFLILIFGQVVMSGIGFGATALVMYRHEKVARQINIGTIVIGGLLLLLSSLYGSLTVVACAVSCIGVGTKLVSAYFAWRLIGVWPITWRMR